LEIWKWEGFGVESESDAEQESDDAPDDIFERGTLAFSHEWGASFAISRADVYELDGRFFAYPDSDSNVDTYTGQGFASLDEAVDAVGGWLFTDASETIECPSLTVSQITSKLDRGFLQEDRDVLINGSLVTVHADG
jgi:hypothetical protein